MSDPAPAVSVVVPTRDRPHSLAACLAALEDQRLPSFEIVVVDDASVDAAAVAAVVARAPHASLVRGHGRGPAAARNLGAATAQAPLLCFTDDDCRPVADWLTAITTRVIGGADVVAGPTRNQKIDDRFADASQTITNFVMAASFDTRTAHLGFAPTSNLAGRAELFRAVPFDDRYPLAAGEDRDWCARVTAQGFAIEYEAAAVVMHAPDLSLRRFWRQQMRYGRGAYRFHRTQPAGSRLMPLTFYGALLHAGFAQGPSVGALVTLAQVATATGIAHERWADCATRRSRNAEPPGSRPGDLV